MRNMDKVLEHLEKYLGTEALQSTGRSKETRDLFDARIGLFKNQPVTGAFTLATIGLSKKNFIQPDNKKVRHELLFCAYDKFLSDRIYEDIFDVLGYLSDQDESIVLGQLFDCEAPIAANSLMECFLFYTPVYFKEELHVIKEIRPPVVFAWIIPIHRRELEFIARHGHEKFDELLEKHNPDLLDLNRGSIVK
jgi:Suppressor of fused protein (SUFU)